jgi:energy-coupling factor transport system ATP-binding protein
VDLSFEITPGETVLVLGPSGSGKSTLTLCLDGLIPHLVDGDYVGRVAVAGLVVEDNPVHVLTQEAGLVFQDPDAQFCTLTVEDEIAFGLENLRRPPEEIEAAIDRALISVGLAGYRRRRLATLSGGEKQRVALAAVLAMGPRLLVLDEPSANLDPRATADLFALLRELAADRRHTMVIIEHKLDELMEWIDSVLVLDATGRLLYRGDPTEAFYRNGGALAGAGVWRPQTVELVEALREAGWDVPGDPVDVTGTVASLAATPGLVERLRGADPGGAGSDARMGGAAVAGRTPSAETAGAASGGGSRGGGASPTGDTALLDVPPAAGRETVLRADGLSHRYGNGHSGRDALSDVSVTLRRGELLAIAGPNGAGKSTLASLLTGVLPPPRDKVFLEGRDITGMTASALSERVGYVFQNPEHQFVSDTVIGELAFSLSPKAGRKGWRHLTPEQRARAESWLERLGLLPLAEASPFALSQGQKRRLSVAAMLIRGQSVLVLDEPTLGQDEAQAARLMAMMQEFRATGGSVAMITHDMRLVGEYADSLLVLAEGRAVYSGTPEDFFSRPEAVAAAGLSVPALGRVAAGLQLVAGTPAGLLSVEAFLSRAGTNGGEG